MQRERNQVPMLRRLLALLKRRFTHQLAPARAPRDDMDLAQRVRLSGEW